MTREMRQRNATCGKLAAFLDWLKQSALPLWGTRGFDSASGRFEERLDFTGDPVVSPQRAMVQARQIYVYAQASIFGWYDDGAMLAETAFRALLRDFKEESGDQASFAFSVDRRGNVISALRDAYTHAFILFALAWMHRLTGNKSHLHLADKVIAFIDGELTDRQHGGFFDNNGADLLSPKRQNPLMHMVEAYLSLNATAPGRGYAERAFELVHVFQTRIVKPGVGHFPELFNHDWSDSGVPGQADSYEPGHCFEWIWLLSNVEGKNSLVRSGLENDLIQTAERLLARPAGLIPDEIHADYAKASRGFRLWPHTEALRIALIGKLPETVLSVDEISIFLLDNFLSNVVPGGWIDRRSRAGDRLVDHMPASSLYHLMSAAAEADRSLALTSRQIAL